MSFTGDSIFWVEVEKIVPNPYQPRREFDEDRLKELAESVRMYGILQPLTVSRKEVIREDGSFYSQYELIAGERRLRAAKLAGLFQVPVIIREGEQDEQEKLELAIIENLQREDLNAVDRALAFKQLADAFDLAHAQVAKKVGRSREYVSNSIRLLLLPDYMLDSLKVGDISEGHARTLLMLNDKPEEQDTVFREILLKKMSVRETERIARKIAHEKVRKKDANNDPQLIELERKFTESLGTRVQILKTDYGGKLTIDYFSEEDLQKMYAVLAQDQDALTFASEPVHSAAQDTAAMDDLTAHTGIESLDESPAAPETSDNTRADATPPPEAVPEPPASTPEHPPTHSQPNAALSQTDDEAVTEPRPADPIGEPAPETFDPSAPAPSPQREVTNAMSTDVAPAQDPAPQPTPAADYTHRHEQPEAAPAPTPAAPDSAATGDVSQPDTPIAEALRRDIAQYLEQDQSATPEANPVPDNEQPTDSTTPMAAHTAPSPASAAPSPATPEQETERNDDSGLYGIRNFTL